MRLTCICRLACLLLLQTACSDTNAPMPTKAGTWQMRASPLNPGTITPSTFQAIVTAVNDTFIVSMPPLVWSGGQTYDTLSRPVFIGGDTAPASTFAITEWCRSLTCFITFVGLMNPGRNSVSSGIVTLYDSTTSSGFLSYIQVASGTFTAHK